MSFPLDLEFIGPRVYASGVISGSALNQWNEDMAIVREIYEKRISTPTYAYTEEDYEQLMGAFDRLLQMADDGVVDGVAVGPINVDMAESLNVLLKTLTIAGIQVNTDINGVYTGLSPIPAADGSVNQLLTIQKWFDLAPAGLGNYINDAIGSVASARSIQALIELEYVTAGNDLITEKLGSLEDALGFTQRSLQILTELQGIHNKVAPIETGEFPGGDLTSSDPDEFVDDFIDIADGTSDFHGFIDPVPVEGNPSVSDSDRFRDLIVEGGEIDTLIDDLLGALGLSRVDIGDAGDGLVGEPIASAAGTLPRQLFVVLADMRKAGTAKAWAEDNMGPDVATFEANRDVGGDYGRNLTAAQVAAQALNDQQKEDVRRTLFIFEEFYKSASGMLIKITQLIERMAQSIAR